MMTVSGLANVSVRSETGESLPLGKFWRDSRALLIFLRHYG
jgi:hypothetical protein